MLLGLRANVCPGYDYDHGDPHESATDFKRMCIHTENKDMHVLFGALGGSCSYR